MSSEQSSILWIPFETTMSQETISIDVRCHQDRILRTTVNRRGKKISFAAHKKYKGFKGEITINLPRFCVLEEEDIYLEIIPEEIITYYNDYCHKQIESEKVITPVLHIERNNGAPFLRCVVVSLPLVSNVSQELLSSRIKTLNHNIELDAPSKQIRIRTTKFSEAGVKFSELSKCLDALAMNDDFSLKYTDLGVYFMVEQLPELEFRFDLRKFQNWQEHRRFRMDPTKFYCLLLNPQRVQTGDYGKWIKTSIPDDFPVENSSKNRHVTGQVVTFWFLNPDHDADHSNRRTVTIRGPLERGSMHIQATFESSNFSQLAHSDGFKVPYHTPSTYEKKSRKMNFADHEMLVHILSLLGDNWVVFLTKCLGYEMDGFHEFILTDVLSTIGARTLDKTKEKLERLRDVLVSNYNIEIEFHADIPSQNLLDSIFHIFISGNIELGQVKKEIISVLKESEVLSKYESFPDSLGRHSLVVLAAALTYVPAEKIRGAIRAMRIPRDNDRVRYFMASEDSEDVMDTS